MYLNTTLFVQNYQELAFMHIFNVRLFLYDTMAVDLCLLCTAKRLIIKRKTSSPVPLTAIFSLALPLLLLLSFHLLFQLIFPLTAALSLLQATPTVPISTFSASAPLPARASGTLPSGRRQTGWRRNSTMRTGCTIPS